jgi:hypothetical protein
MQALVTYILVALAALWVVWSVLLPKSIRTSIRGALGRRGVLHRGCCTEDGAGTKVVRKKPSTEAS